MKTNQKYILKELLEEYPELKNEKNLGEIITWLQKLNPEIKASEKFKRNLKNRLLAIWLYENYTHSKFSYIKFLMPVFSFWMVIFGFYYFSDTFINNNQHITKDTPSQMKIFSDPISSDIQVENSNIENKNYKVQEESIEQKNVIKTAPTNIPSFINNDQEAFEEESSIINFKWDSDASGQMEEIDNAAESYKIEDTELIDLFWDDRANWSEMIEWSQNTDIFGDHLWLPIESIKIWWSQEIDIGWEELIFEDYCENEWWEIRDVDNEKICIKDKKECQSKDYKNWTCEFREIK